MKLTYKPLAVALASIFTVGALYSVPAFADANTDEINALKAQMNLLMKRIDDLSKKQDDAAQAAAKQPAQSGVPAAERLPVPDSYKPGTVNMYVGESNPNVVDSGNFLQRTRDDSLTFSTGRSGGGVTFYGNFDVSIDDTTNGISTAHNDGALTNGGAGTGPFGNTGWIPAISTNNTYVGLRGFQPVGGWDSAQFLWQIQTNIALTAIAGTGETNSTVSNGVTGALSTGTTYLGFGNAGYGSLKIGKTYAPYDISTQVFNPFRGMLGSMGVIMGNTGGDNRIEFGSLLEHSLWYESLNYNGLSFSALFSPGQNVANNSNNLPMGGSNCAGGDTPGNGGNVNLEGQVGCNDGGFSNAFSTSVVYDDKKAWYATAAYEVHEKVNRSSDLAGETAIPTGYTSAQLDAQDVATEWAAKVGVMYTFDSTGTAIGGIYEWMRRDVPQDLAYQNERSRNGSWFLIEQNFSGGNQVNFGWGHAERAEGDPGQHNDSTIAGSPGQRPDNSANMYTIALIHQVDRNLSFYTNYAITENGPAAHYDLGAGGHGYYVDCHDAGGPISASGTIDSGPNCWTGTKIQGFTAGMKYRF
jgi:hypothetical protein